MDNTISFHTGALAAYSAVEAIGRIARAGYGGVELNAETLPWAAPHVTPALSAAERRAIRDAAADAGLTITSISAHIGLVEADPQARRAAIEHSKGCADLALDLGVDVIHGLTGAAPDGVTEPEAWDWVLAAVAEIAEYCAARGVAFGIEPVVGMLVHDGASLGRLLAALPAHRVGVNYDPSHLQLAGDDPAEVARRFADRIVAVHLKDAKGTTAEFAFPPLGLGEVDFAALAAALRAADYRGSLSVEYEAQAHGGYTLAEREILEGSLAFVRRYFAE